MLHTLFVLLALQTPHTGPDLTLPFPMTETSRGSERDGIDLVARVEDMALLRTADRVVLTHLPLSNGSHVDVEVERVEFDRASLDLRIDGVPSTLDAGPDASTWRGRVVGDDTSDVFLGLSPLGSRGWIRVEGEYFHLLAGPGANGDWSRSVSKIVGEASLNARGFTLNAMCPVDESFAPNGFPQPSGAPGGSLTTDLLECKMAIETDYPLYQRFNDAAAELNYLTQLFAAASARYEADLNVLLTVTYLGLHSNVNDGWTSGDGGSSAGSVLDEFRSAWQWAIPGGANLAHFVSGAGLGGGVAYLDVLCNPAWGFAVSGDLSGNMPFPVVQGPLTWDFMVFTHETGHNFGSPHTHDFCPPLDRCAPSGYFGSCQTSQACISDGSIMSYCHLCGGGMNNMSLVLHPDCASLMRQRAESSCIPTFCTSPTTYCAASPNSYDVFGAQIGFWGTNRVSNNDLTLTTTSVPPGTSAMYYYGRNTAFAPFGNGVRCIGNPVYRFPILSASPFADVTFQVDLNALPAAGQIHAGETWKFQLWFRNPAGGGAGFNLSDALSVAFCP